MKKRIVSIILALMLLLSASLSVYAAENESVFEKTGSFFEDQLVKLKFGNSFYANQWQTVKSVEKLGDNIYMLDYAYDYDIDDLLNRGCGSIVDLLAYCSGHILSGRSSFDIHLDELGCSIFTCSDTSGNRLMGRNFDYKDAPCFVVWTDPADGYASVSMVDANMMLFGDLNKPWSATNSLQVLLAPYIPLDGINEKGLSIGVLQVKADGTAQDTGKKDILTTVAIRAVLDKAADVEEAVELLSGFDMQDMLFGCSYHYQLSDAKGNSCVIEYIDNEMRIIWGETNESGVVTQAVTNFFLSPDGKADTPEGQERYARMQDALEECSGVMTETEALQLLNRVHLNYKHKKYPWYVTTLWSAVYNASEGTLTMCARMNYDAIYRFRVGDPKNAVCINDNARIENYISASN